MKSNSVSSANCYPSRSPARIVERFDSQFREEIARLTKRSKVFEDLLQSFPGLLIAIVSEYGDEKNRRNAQRKLVTGGKLREAAKIFGVPWWLRKLPPEAFTESLKLLPDTEQFSRQISNLIPENTAEIPEWFRSVSRANEICHEKFALWVAKRPVFYKNPDNENYPLELVAAWAWHADQPHTEGFELLKKHWHPRMNSYMAIEEAKSWYNRSKMAILFGETELEDTWLSGGEACGYRFSPLRTASDFFAESEKMNNCLDQYADHLKFGDIRVFSVWKDQTRVANIEIGAHEDDRSIPTIEQVRGPQNSRVSPEVWRAAYAWIGSQDFTLYRQMKSASLPQERQNYPNRFWHRYADDMQTKTDQPVDLPVIDLDRSDMLLIRLEAIISEFETAD